MTLTNTTSDDRWESEKGAFAVDNVTHVVCSHCHHNLNKLGGCDNCRRYIAGKPTEDEITKQLKRYEKLDNGKAITNRYWKELKKK